MTLKGASAFSGDTSAVVYEAILNREGRGRFRAFSAGSRPKGEVHPLTLETLRRYGYDASGLRSKSWDEFTAPDAPMDDAVITVWNGERFVAYQQWLASAPLAANAHSPVP